MLHILYKKLLKFYPEKFREQLAESMEQTFNDRYIEVRNAKKGLFGFTILTFADTTIGIFREHLLQGDIMQTTFKNLILSTLKNIALSALFSFLLTLPLIIMEVVNRRNFNEDFPYTLFFGLWLSLFFISFIVLPIVLSRWSSKNENTNPRLASIISIVLILIIAIISSLGSETTEALNTEYISVFGLRVPGQLIAFAIFLLPVAAAIIASRPIINTLQAGGSLFAHPIQLIIVSVILLLLTIGVGSLIIDQWPCFVGVPNCD